VARGILSEPAADICRAWTSWRLGTSSGGKQSVQGADDVLRASNNNQARTAQRHPRQPSFTRTHCSEWLPTNDDSPRR
jgi:hypothetical protein